MPIFSVANASLTVMENAETVMICVNLTGPSGGLERSEEAQFVAVPGTALSKTIMLALFMSCNY